MQLNRLAAFSLLLATMAPTRASGQGEAPMTLDDACSLIAHQRVGAIEALRTIIAHLLDVEPDDRTRLNLGRAYNCLAKAYLRAAPKPPAESMAELVQHMRGQLAQLYFERAFEYDPELEPEKDTLFLDEDKRRIATNAREEWARTMEKRRAEAHRIVEEARTEWLQKEREAWEREARRREEELLTRLREAEEALAKQTTELQTQREEIATLRREAGAGPRFGVSVGPALAAPQIKDRDGNLRTLQAYLLFVGVDLHATQRDAVGFSLGLAEGVGLAGNTARGFVIGPAVRLEVWRVGVVGGFGWRLSTRDRARHTKGVAIGLTFRVCSFRPRW